MPPRSERRNNLINYARDEFQKYKAKEISILSSSRELASKFGYPDSTKVATLLGKDIPDIQHQRVGILRPWRKEFDKPTSSIELAWLMGAMSGSGHCDPGQKRTHQAQFATTEIDFANKFHSIGEYLFKLNLPIQTRGLLKKNVKPMHWVVFNRRGVVDFFDKISRSSWPETIKALYPWILTNPEYSRQFLNGYFDARGSVELPRINQKSGGQIRILTSYQ